MGAISKDYGPYYQETLDDLYREIAAYEREADLWTLLPGTSNSAGNLALHLMGNLNHFIGYGLGDSDYVRDRPAEFNAKGVSQQDILISIRQTQQMLQQVFETLPDDILDQEYAKPLWGDDSGTVRYFLNKLIWHLGYHVGQVNYHRRWANEHLSR